MKHENEYMENLMNDSINRRDFVQTALGASLLPFAPRCVPADPPKRPNIVWICAEDMSANMSCYGETAIQTPNIDRLAREGARFSNAFVTCPVCSPSRSAVITGMYQTTIGAHNHRSSRHQTKIRLPEQIQLIPEYFKQAGYYVSNGGMFSTDPNKRPEKGKTDYNFEFDPSLYHGSDWRDRKPGQPFFAQIQLHGGKNRSAKVPHPVDPNSVTLPPYYPDHPVLRNDWAEYLNSVIQTDIEVGRILDRLVNEGELENTLIVFWTDHGISHIRDKQFLYDGGIHVPLILRGPGIEAGSTVDHLVEHIDISYTTLEYASLPVPSHLQGRSLLRNDQSPRERIVSARDRCDETVERIRCVRAERFKYIRNYFPDRSHTQPNQYKDNKQIMKTMRELSAQGKLDDHQSSMFQPTRPIEELYDLLQDPFELNNLAESERHRTVLEEMRQHLNRWMDESHDLGEIPEPELDDLTRRYPSAYDLLQDSNNKRLVHDLRALIDGWKEGGHGIDRLIEALHDPRSAIRCQAAMELGKLGEHAAPAKARFTELLNDPSASVRVAAARALTRTGLSRQAIETLVHELRHAELESVRHYAALGLEDLREQARPFLPVVRQARQDPYEYVKRVANRIVSSLG